MPSPLLVKVPLLTPLTAVMRAWSGSKSLDSSCACVMMIGVPSTVWKLSLAASGAPSSTGVTLTVTVFGTVSNKPLLSRTLKVRVA